jgi:tryptophanyl-tRNA synthetase
MSTTAESDAGVIRVLDPPETVAKKVKSAVTDSGSEVMRSPDKPGITNLIDILAVIRGVEPAQVESEFNGSGYGQFKQAVADAVVDYLAPVRERYEELRPDEQHLHAILHAGAEKAHAIAHETVAVARDRMGVGPPS